MVRQRAKALKVPADSTAWIPSAIETCRDLDGLGVTIDVRNFASATDLKQDLVCSEQRLRKLSNLGWLRMSVERIDGKFVRYIWRLS
jgi:hypothetical protein